VDQRPKTVEVVAAFLFIATGIAVIVAASLLFPTPWGQSLLELNKPAEAVFRKNGMASGAFLLLLGAGTLASAVGLLRHRVWAWWFAIILFAINVCGDVVSFAITGDLLRSVAGVSIGATLLWFLTRRAVRCYFHR
jgi:hypothetical protein